MDDFLEHHGIKGQKWGVRRYQNEDGSLTPEGRVRYLAARRVRNAAKTKNAVDTIVAQFTPAQREAFGMRVEDTDYLSIEQGEHVIKRFLKTNGSTPVAFLDILYDGDGIATVAVGVNNAYAGKGYATELGKQAAKWVDTNRSGVKELKWSPYAYNEASKKVAEKAGFILKDKNDRNKKGKVWIDYVKRRGE